MAPYQAPPNVTPPFGLLLGELYAALAASWAGDAAPRAQTLNQAVCGLTQDSRLLVPGDVFVARPGAEQLDWSHAEQAAARGAVALIVERGQPVPKVSCPVLLVADLSGALALAASAVYAAPSQALEVVGITGTNGKTTCAALISSALEALGVSVGRIGTLGFKFGEHEEPSLFTTPPADELAKRLAYVRDAGGTHAVLEVSSHALDQRRVEGIRFSVAAFTNLTQDHLDYHGDLASYGAAKARLFSEFNPRRSVINVDDAFGRELAQRAPNCLTVSRLSAAATVTGTELEISARGIAGPVVCGAQTLTLRSELVGAHNADNLLLSLAVLVALGYPSHSAVEALSRAPAAPGRLERCDGAADDLLVLVDYAHTPDALARALQAARALGDERLWCVFGCGGDRDPTKRALMGEVVGRLADRAIVSNDNPRTESAESIAEAIVSGLRRHTASFEVELDRARAIDQVVQRASAGDVVLIAGKGHEPYQIIGRERRPFDDREQARAALARRRAQGAR